MHENYGALADSLYLIRPDGHICFICYPATEEKLLKHLNTIFHVSATEVETGDVERTK